MKSCEFKGMFPQSRFSLDSFLLLLKNSTSIGTQYSCTKETISLNSIKTVNRFATPLTLQNNQVFLVIFGSTGLNLGAPSGVIYFDLNGNSDTINPYCALEDFVGTKSMSSANGYFTVAIFDLF